jgi:hypothetical protein
MRITFAFNSSVVYVFGCFHCVSSELFLVFKFILVLLVKTFQVCFVKTFVLFAHYKVDNFLYKNLILKRYATTPLGYPPLQGGASYTRTQEIATSNLKKNCRNFIQGDLRGIMSPIE